MEKRDLYDANFNLIGKTIEKNEEIPKNTYILIVAVFIQNDKDEFLIQKRSLNKDGKWATTGGHPKAGETSLEGILTEVKEELGITINEPTLFKRVHDDKYFCDLYYIKENVDISEVHLQTELNVENIYNFSKLEKEQMKLIRELMSRPMDKYNIYKYGLYISMVVCEIKGYDKVKELLKNA